jgi:hypothetical protein
MLNSPCPSIHALLTCTERRSPTRALLQAALVYAEVLLIAQYSYLCLVRCVCEAPTASNSEGELSPGVWNEVGTPLAYHYLCTAFQKYTMSRADRSMLRCTRVSCRDIQQDTRVQHRLD